MKKIQENNLSRSEKILLYLYEVGKGKKMKVRYEDIVVGVFKKYPTDFHLKGYTEYPDSGDLIHKPLYDFKKKGYINAENKVFSLTDRGLELGEQLNKKGGKTTPESDDRLSRGTETELARIKGLEGFSLFLDGNNNKLSDNDFYSYLGVTVRTPKNAFIGRLNTMNAMIEELKERTDDTLASRAVDYHLYILEKYRDIIDYFTKN